ncbi:MAG: Rieske 2Fe-2S domain-containing protein [Acidimicrobiia bacterium]
MAHRFPFPMPFGWFCVSLASGLAAGDVRSVHYFDRDLVLWRDEVGTAHLQDAYCAHLGAHLGVGGTVEGECLRCPFHGWLWNADGRCTEIPYSKRVNRKARLRTYPLVERNRLLMAWYHPHDAPPTHDVPEVAECSDPEYGEFRSSDYVVKSAIQEMAENAVDPAHFQAVHGHPQTGEIDEYRLDGVHQVMLSKQKFPTSRGPIDARIDVYKTGAGFAVTRYQGLIDAALIGCSTPIDDETVHLRFNFTLRNPEADERTQRIADAFVKEVNRQLGQDIPIWENKVYRPIPALADTDGPIIEFRKWFAQFYVDDSSETQAVDA